MDWKKNGVRFFIGDYLVRTIIKKNRAFLFNTCSPLFFRHWSKGNIYFSQGPLKKSIMANVGWKRSFFNFSTEEEHINFWHRCHISDACLIADMTWRGSTPHPEEVNLLWKQKPMSRSRRTVAIWIAVICIIMTACFC